MKHYSTKAKNRVYLQAGGLAATSGSGEALCIFRLTLELCGYKPHGVLDASPTPQQALPPPALERPEGPDSGSTSARALPLPLPGHGPLPPASHR
jgi:hypothetical protein